MANKVLLFENQTTNASSSGALLGAKRGYFIGVAGVLDGGTVTIEMWLAEAWLPLDGGVFDAVGAYFLQGSEGSKQIRATIAGATGSLDATVEVTT